MPMIDGFLAEYDQENAGTRKMLERYPEGKNDWKPHDKSMSLTQLAGHLSTLPNFAHMIATTEHYDMGPNDYKPFFPNTGKEAVERFDADSKKARDAMAKLSDADMHKNWIFSWQSAGSASITRCIIAGSSRCITGSTACPCPVCMARAQTIKAALVSAGRLAR